MKRPLRGTVLLRERGTDLLTFMEIVEEEVYGSVLQYTRGAQTVVDLGAHIGLASLFFAAHAPGCRIFAVEANPANYALLTQNLRPLVHRAQCQALNAAVWGRPAILTTEVENDRHSTATVREVLPDEKCEVLIPGMDMASLLERSGFGTVDLLKVDIEGAEVQLFSGDLNWLDNVRTIAIEFHVETRKECGFDAIMLRHGFQLVDERRHTLVASRRNRASSSRHSNGYNRDNQ